MVNLIIHSRIGNRENIHKDLRPVMQQHEGALLANGKL
jgi:hypothetical protein